MKKVSVFLLAAALAVLAAACGLQPLPEVTEASKPETIEAAAEPDETAEQLEQTEENTAEQTKQIDVQKIISLKQIGDVFGDELVQNESLPSGDNSLNLSFKKIPDSVLSINIYDNNADAIYESSEVSESLRVVKDIEGTGDKAFFFEHNNGAQGIEFMANGVYVQIVIVMPLYEGAVGEDVARQIFSNTEQYLKALAQEILSGLNG